MVFYATFNSISLITRKNCFRYLKLMSPHNAAICTTISYTLWLKWYYLKNNYLTLRSKVKVPQRSLWYATHRLMVMHPHTKYHWPISKDKNVMARTRKYYLKNNYSTLRSTVKVKQRSLWYATHKNIYVLLLKEVGNIGIHLGWRKGFDIFWKGDKAASCVCFSQI